MVPTNQNTAVPPSTTGNPPTADVAALHSKIRQLELQLVALQNYEDEYNRIRLDSERQQEQLHAVGIERDRLRTQLDKMTSIESKLVALKSKADSAEVIEGERDDLADQIKQKDRQIVQMQRDQVASRETLGTLQRENREMLEKAESYRKSVDEYRVFII